MNLLNNKLIAKKQGKIVQAGCPSIISNDLRRKFLVYLQKQMCQNNGFHLEAIIVSDDFQKISLLKRHKMVYKALGDLMKHEIHALSMKTLTIKEWKNY